MKRWELKSVKMRFVSPASIRYFVFLVTIVYRNLVRTIFKSAPLCTVGQSSADSVVFQKINDSLRGTRGMLKDTGLKRQREVILVRHPIKWITMYDAVRYLQSSKEGS